MKRKQTDPPKWAIKVLAWFCPDHLYEEIEGDLIEKFVRDLQLFGCGSAKRKFIWNADRFLRPGIILRKKVLIELNPLDMILNHLKFASRLFLKDKFFSVLNILRWNRDFIPLSPHCIGATIEL